MFENSTVTTRENKTFIYLFIYLSQTGVLFELPTYTIGALKYRSNTVNSNTVNLITYLSYN